MADEIALRKASERGDRAQALKDNPLLTECFRQLHEDYLLAWSKSKTRDTDGRERLWQAVKILETVEGNLQRMIDRGKVAKYEIEAISRLNASKTPE